MKIKTSCEYGNHDSDPIDTYIYTDEKNGIENDTSICRDCLRAHMRKFYPDRAGK